VQWATNRTGGGVQQSTIVGVIFVVNVKGFWEFVTFTAFLINFTVRAPGNKKVNAPPVKFIIFIPL